MSQSFAISITPALKTYVQALIPSNANYADYIGLYLGGGWSSPSVSSQQYLSLSALHQDSQGRFTFTADSGSAARVYVLVPSQSQVSAPTPWAAPWAKGSSQPASTTLSQTGYVYAYGESNFDGISAGNMDTTYIDTFGLPYQLTKLDAIGNPTSVTINAGVGEASAIYRAAANGRNQISYRPGSDQEICFNGALVPPANASKKMYHDFASYFNYLSRQTKRDNYSVWLKNGDNSATAYTNQLYDGTAAFYGFNGKSGSKGRGYIVIGGTVNDSAGSPTTKDYSVIIPWSLKDLSRLGLSSVVANYKQSKQSKLGNFLSKSPYAYQNDITGFWVPGNVFETKSGKSIPPNRLTARTVANAFANATPWDISYQNPKYNAPPIDQLPLMVGDVFFGLNKGMLASEVDFVTGFRSKDVGKKIYKGVRPTMDIGELPSEAWYSNSTDYTDASDSSLYWSGVLNPANNWTGNQIIGPVAKGLWGPWAWGSSKKNYWNKWSFALAGKAAKSGQSYQPNNLATANSPLLPDTYTWAMDDRMGGQLLQFGNSPLQMTFDAPFALCGEPA